jgi:hypothetical protein
MARKKPSVLRPDVSARATADGPLLLVALERLLGFPQNQDSTELDLLAAINQAQRLVHRVRGGPDI